MCVINTRIQLKKVFVYHVTIKGEFVQISDIQHMAGVLSVQLLP